MFMRKLAGVVVAGLLFGAGAVNARDSVFPSSANEIASSDWYAGHYQRATNGATGGATQPVFPSATIEFGTGTAYDSAALPRTTRRVIGSTGPVFPSSSNEVTPYM